MANVKLPLMYELAVFSSSSINFSPSPYLPPKKPKNKQKNKAKRKKQNPKNFSPFTAISRAIWVSRFVS